jgi:hypothetical protein
MISEGISEGTLKQVHPKTTARLILAVALGMLIQGLLDPQEADWDEVTKESMQILLGGLMKR